MVRETAKCHSTSWVTVKLVAFGRFTNGKVVTLQSSRLPELQSQKGLAPFRPSAGFPNLGHMGPLKTLLGYMLIS
jgi:hypothetical protein